MSPDSPSTESNTDRSTNPEGSGQTSELNNNEMGKTQVNAVDTNTETGFACGDEVRTEDIAEGRRGYPGPKGDRKIYQSSESSESETDESSGSVGLDLRVSKNEDDLRRLSAGASLQGLGQDKVRFVVFKITEIYLLKLDRRIESFNCFLRILLSCFL